MFKKMDISFKPAAPAGSYEAQRCFLDLYVPEATPLATLVWFHGGGLENFDGKGEAQLAERFVKSGLAVVLPNYRLIPQGAKYPDFIDDAAAAIAWTLDHIAEYRGDAKKVFVSGHSAGAYLLTMVALDPAYLARYGHHPNELAGAIPVSGQMITHAAVRKLRGIGYETPFLDDAAPCYHVRPDAPPFLNLFGDGDLPTRPEENRYFVAAMKHAGHPDIQAVEIADRDHVGISTHLTDPNDPAAEAMLDFIRKHVS